MRKLIATAALAAAMAALAACGEKPGAGGLTENDNRELNNAAEMLDTSPDSLVANDEAPLGNGEEDAVDANAAQGNNASDEDVD